VTRRTLLGTSIAAGLLTLGSSGLVVRAQASPDADAEVGTSAPLGPELDLFRPLVGDWTVERRLWTTADAEPTTLPPAIARRRMIQDVFLEEVMEPAPGSDQPPFTRTAFLSFNDLNGRYEYVSLDSSYPPMMFETAFDNTLTNGNTIKVYHDAFVSPGFDPGSAGQLLKQRRDFTVESADRVIMTQYWTPPSGEEYLGLETLYTRAT